MQFLIMMSMVFSHTYDMMCMEGYDKGTKQVDLDEIKRMS